MPIVATLWEDRDFHGFTRTLSTGSGRYWWIRYGSQANDELSSEKAWGIGARGHAYAFEHRDFNGTFNALNMNVGETAWWSYFGGVLNDKVSSSLVVARAPVESEIEVALRGQIAPQFVGLFDASSQGTALSRRGEPRVYGTFFPHWDIDRIYVTIDQNLTVDVPNWFDYDANVRYDIAFFVGGTGQLHARAVWSHVWVESGILSSSVMDRIKGKLHGAKAQITAALESRLSLLGRTRLVDAYLLPGAPPDMTQAGFIAHYDDDVTLVAVRS